MVSRAEAVADVLRAAPVIPVLIIDGAGAAVPLARALTEGGLTSIEVTLRTAEAIEAIRLIAAEVPEAVVGAGTVLSPAQVDAAFAAGARFLVSPGSTEDLLAEVEQTELPFLPGAATASEAMRLIERGYRHAKFFPAEAAGGAAVLKALASPLPELAFCPTGGVTTANAAAYLALANVACVGGSWVAPPEAVAAGDWARIKALSREAAALPRRFGKDGS